jgi:transcriptional regulator with XRE-family HTH domain
VAAAVRRLRRIRKLSQEGLAAECRLHRTYIGAIERSEGNITLDTLDKLARALKVKSGDLLKDR